MKLLPNQVDHNLFSRLREELVTLFEKRDFCSIADRFGYALAYGRDPAKAIEAELLSCFSEFRMLPQPQVVVSPSIVVKRFTDNDLSLVAVIECHFFMAGGCPVLAELIVTGKGEDMHVSLEQVSLPT